jgi:hypothetical protein
LKQHQEKGGEEGGGRSCIGWNGTISKVPVDGVAQAEGRKGTGKAKGKMEASSRVVESGADGMEKSRGASRMPMDEVARGGESWAAGCDGGPILVVGD